MLVGHPVWLSSTLYFHLSQYIPIISSPLLLFFFHIQTFPYFPQTHSLDANISKGIEPQNILNRDIIFLLIPIPGFNQILVKSKGFKNMPCALHSSFILKASNPSKRKEKPVLRQRGHFHPEFLK